MKNIIKLFFLLFFSFGLLSQSKKERIELLSHKIDSIYQVDSLKNVNISFLNTKVHELNEQNKILNQINENYKNELSNLEFRLYNDSILRNDLKLKSIYLENQLLLLNDSLKIYQNNNKKSYLKNILNIKPIKNDSLYADYFIKNELLSKNDSNVENYYINHLFGDINLDGKNDLLIYYLIYGQDLGAEIGLGWCIIFSDEKGNSKNYLIFDWHQGRCSTNSNSLGVPMKITNGTIYTKMFSYDKNDACCCPSISLEKTFKLDNYKKLLNSIDYRDEIRPSFFPIVE